MRGLRPEWRPLRLLIIGCPGCGLLGFLKPGARICRACIESPRCPASKAQLEALKALLSHPDVKAIRVIGATRRRP